MKIAFWITHILFSLFILFDAIGGITHQQDGVDIMNHLGYPIYVLTIFGVAKFCGLIAILQPKFQTIREWGYAGFTINFFGAAASRYFIGDGAFEIIMPFLFLVFMLIPYFLRKKLENESTLA